MKDEVKQYMDDYIIGNPDIDLNNLSVFTQPDELHYLANVVNWDIHIPMFPRCVSYNRFVELEKEILLPLTIFIKKVLLGSCTGISFVDSTPFRVCRNQRILIHKTFEGLAERGRCSMGWFFGFKLHLIINDKGEILNFMFTPGNVDDREPLKQGKFLENIKGKLCADKGIYRSDFVREPLS